MSRYNEQLYQAQTYDSSNNCIGVHDDLVSLYYKKIVNGVGLAILTVPDSHPMIANLADDLLLEVWLSYPSLAPTTYYGPDIGWESDFLGLYRDKQIATDENGNLYYLLYFPEATDALQRDIIAWPAGTNVKSTWTARPIAALANDIVATNCTAAATIANGRIRDANPVRRLTGNGAVPGTTAVNFSGNSRNVLEVLQELSAQTREFDFAVIRNTANSLPNDLAYQEYAGQLGADLSASLIFDINLDNVNTISLNGDRLREKTVAIVGGQGEGSARQFAVRTGANQSASNDYEVFVDARDKPSTELNAIGDARMKELQARTNITTEILTSPGYIYKRDYELGDLVTARVAGVSARKKINNVEVKFDQDQNSSVRLELIDW